MLKKVACLAFAAAALAPNGASAAVITDNLAVSATVSGSCSLSAAAGIAFGTVASTLTQINASPVNLVVNCTSGTPYSIGISYGPNSNGSTRRMFDGAGTPVSTDYLIYEIYLDAGRATAVAPTGTNTIPGTGTGANANVPIYPSILAQATPAATTFNETLVVSLNY
jgi:spore coat protein U-like protein